MTQRPLALSDDNITRISERETGTEWFGSSILSLSDVFDSAERSAGVEQEPERQGSITARSSSAISERLIEAIDAISAVTQSPVTERFIALQEWEGFVSEIGEKVFVARLVDMTRKDNPEEEADFLIEDVRNDDLKLLRPGAVFRWIIGYDVKKDGAKSRRGIDCWNNRRGNARRDDSDRGQTLWGHSY